MDERMDKQNSHQNFPRKKKFEIFTLKNAILTGMFTSFFHLFSSWSKEEEVVYDFYSYP